MSNQKTNHQGDSAVEGVTPRAIDYDRVQELGRALLVALGEDPNREGLQETPRRWAAWWREFIEYDPGNIDTAFKTASLGQMVIVSGITVYSLCEHHLLPFSCDVSVGYLTHEKVLGLSKFARIAQDVAHQLQLQEQIADTIAAEVARVTCSEDVIVACSGVHLCMVMRGIKTNGVMTSLTARGQFANNQGKRLEFLNLIARNPL